METLTKAEIIKGNKLIAEFLGYEYILYSPDSKLSPGWWKQNTPARILNHPSKSKFTPTYYLCRRHTELRYYNSWDELIPAMSKLNNMYGNEQITKKTKTYMYARMAGEAMLRFDRPTCFTYVVLMIEELNKENV